MNEKRHFDWLDRIVSQNRLMLKIEKKNLTSEEVHRLYALLQLNLLYFK